MSMDCDDRLSHLKELVSDTDRMVDEIEKNLNFIHKKHELSEQTVTSDSVNCLTLEHSKQKEFIECISSGRDILQNLSQNGSNLQPLSPTSLLSTLDDVETVVQKNEKILEVLEKQVNKVLSLKRMTVANEDHTET